MARKIGQIIRRRSSTWLVRIYVGRNPETRKRRHIGKFIHGGYHRPNSNARKEIDAANRQWVDVMKSGNAARWDQEMRKMQLAAARAGNCILRASRSL